VPSKVSDLREIRYFVVGCCNFILAFLIFVLFSFQDVLYDNPTLNLLVSAFFSVPLAHLTQRKFVWISNSNYRRELIRFVSISSLGLLTNIILLGILSDLLTQSVLIIQLVLSALITLVTYYLHMLWTFSKAKKV